MIRALSLLLLAIPFAAPAAERLLFNGKNLDGWESIGDGQWTVMRDGTLLGQRTADVRKMLIPGATFQTKQEFERWENTQAWLYTQRNDFGEFDLHVEFWTRTQGNSGISIRDTSRAQYAVVTPPNFNKTPAKIGYEIQINNRYPDPHPAGSIYTFVDAKPGAMREDDWNSFDIAVRNDKITVKLNGVVVAEHAGDPNRSKTGPIGLQLHDQFSVIMFRNIRIRELGK
ncbi:MAG: DUF1080 domain-containing protein [Bryobacterales bacterium]|nr:DUF1080 domain-containing protein [Bryobacterales bacterium]